MSLSVDTVLTLVAFAAGIGTFVGQTKSLKDTMSHLAKAVDRLADVINDHETRLTVVEDRLVRHHEMGR